MTDTQASTDLVGTVTYGPAGELLSMGGAAVSGTTLSPGGVIGTLSGNTRLLFDGTAATLLSASATTIRGYVPSNVQGKSTVQVVVQVNGTSLPALGVAVSDASPGVFTVDGSGQGPALCYNMDGTSNSSDLPSASGNTIVFYITGGGMTNPAVADGQLISGVLPVLAQSLSVTIGGATATVLRANTIPYEVAGVIEVAVIVPSDAPSGAVALVVTAANGVQSQGGVTVAIQ